MKVRVTKLYTRLVITHLACWLIFIAYELIFLYYLNGKIESLMTYVYYYILNILFFYAYAALMTVVFDGATARYLKGLMLFTALVSIYLLAKFALGFLLEVPHQPINTYFNFFIRILPTTLYRASYFTILGTFYWAGGHISHFRKQASAAEKQQLIILRDKAELETRLAESRNAYLKQQVSPHLLFNTLNFIYSSVYQNSPEASHSVILLSDIMRFSLEETGSDGKVPLIKEMEQLHNLVEINRYRYETQLAISTEFEGYFERFRIIPLILLTLTENLFKHGNLSDPAYPALLRLSVTEEGRLLFYCKNLKKSKSDYARSQQIGLQNVRIRLNFAYPDQYEMSVSETENFYELTLNLHL